MDNRNDKLEEIKVLMQSIAKDIQEEGKFDVFSYYPTSLPSFDELADLIGKIYFK